MINKIFPSVNKIAKLIRTDYFATLSPELERPVDPVAARRLLLNHLLVMSLESNTRQLVKRQLWSKEDKLVGALHYRINELYDRIFKHTTSRHADWLVQVSGLIDAAAVPILAIAVEDDPEKRDPLRFLLTNLAVMAGTYQDEIDPEQQAEQEVE